MSLYILVYPRIPFYTLICPCIPSYVLVYPHIPLITFIATPSLLTTILSYPSDKLVNALVPSNTDLPSTASPSQLKDLETFLDRIVMVKFQPNSQYSSPSSSPTNSSKPPPPILTARIIAIHCGNEIISNSTNGGVNLPVSAQSTELDKSSPSSTTAKESSSLSPITSAPLTPSSFTPFSHTATSQVFIDVEYLADGTREENVSADRVKQSSDAPDATLLLNLIDDLAKQIGGFLPNRPDLRAAIYQPIDFQLLKQIVENNAVTPSKDILPILVHLIQRIKDLQAPNRVESMHVWLDGFFSQWYYPSVPSVPSTPSETGVENTLPPIPPTSSVRAVLGAPKPFSEIVPLLPAFFDKANDFLEQVRWMAAEYEG